MAKGARDTEGKGKGRVKRVNVPRWGCHRYGGLRIFGPNGCDQSHTPGGDPSHRKRAPGCGGKRGKGGGETTSGGGVHNLGVRAGMEGGVGSGKECERMEENGGRPCLVLSDRDKALKSVEVLKAIWGIQWRDW